MNTSLLDRIYGCVIGGAIGDAFGAPTEAVDYWDIRTQYGKLDRLIASPATNSNQKPGGITDDTALRQLIALAIVRRQGRITPDDLAAVWIEKGNLRRFWANERAITERLNWGMDPWHTGKGAQKCATGSMAIGPVGIINAGNPRQAFQDGFNIASINQDDLERDAAGTMAAGVAAALAPGATPARIVEAMIEHSSFLMKRGFELALDVAAKVRNADEFTERYTELYADWSFPRPPRKIVGVPKDRPLRCKYYSGDSHELLPVTVALLNHCDWDPDASIIENANYGRDCDSTASMAGALAGALHGASRLRRQWIETVEAANEDLFVELEGDPKANFRVSAERLHAALVAESARQAEQAAALQRLVAG